MRIAIMQPYFFPYIGYWQLIKAVDKFVIYDNIQFTKKGWIRRNRILLNSKEKVISLPIKKDASYSDINMLYISESFKKDKLKIINQIEMAYKKAPYFADTFPLIIEALNYEKDNLFEFLYNSIRLALNYLKIETEVIISSDININHSLKNKDKVLAICKELKGEIYINAIGGLDLYNKDEFNKNEIELKFIKTDSIQYKQFNNEFIPNLSIIDVMMFNSPDEINKMLDKYELV